MHCFPLCSSYARNERIMTHSDVIHLPGYCHFSVIAPLFPWVEDESDERVCRFVSREGTSRTLASLCSPYLSVWPVAPHYCALDECDRLLGIGARCHRGRCIISDVRTQRVTTDWIQTTFKYQKLHIFYGTQIHWQSCFWSHCISLTADLLTTNHFILAAFHPDSQLIKLFSLWQNIGIPTPT